MHACAVATATLAECTAHPCLAIAIVTHGTADILGKLQRGLYLLFMRKRALCCHMPLYPIPTFLTSHAPSLTPHGRCQLPSCMRRADAEPFPPITAQPRGAMQPHARLIKCHQVWSPLSISKGSAAGDNEFGGTPRHHRAEDASKWVRRCKRCSRTRAVVHRTAACRSSRGLKRGCVRPLSFKQGRLLETVQG